MKWNWWGIPIYYNWIYESWMFEYKEKSNSKTKAEINYVWTKPLNWLKILGHVPTRSSKTETRAKSDKDTYVTSHGRMRTHHWCCRKEDRKLI